MHQPPFSGDYVPLLDNYAVSLLPISQLNKCHPACINQKHRPAAKRKIRELHFLWISEIIIKVSADLRDKV